MQHKSVADVQDARAATAPIDASATRIVRISFMKPPTRQRKSTAHSAWWQSSSSTTAAAATTRPTHAHTPKPKQQRKKAPARKPLTFRSTTPPARQQQQLEQQQCQPHQAQQQQPQQQQVHAGPSFTASPTLGTPLPPMQLPGGSLGFPVVPTQTQEPLLFSPPQVGGVHSSRHLHKFLQQWLPANLPQIMPHGRFQHRAEVRSGLQNPYKRADNIVYLLNRPLPRYVMIELDPLEHRGNGLVEDVFRVNWFYKARFSGGKLYVIRVNPSAYEQADGMLADPVLSDRLAKLAQLLGFLSEQAYGRDCTVIRCFYMFYSVARLQHFKHKLECELLEVQKDVLYCLTFRPGANPSYLGQL